MRKSNKFWHDVDFAIRSLMLRQLLRQIINEGRNTRQSLWEITKPVQSMPGRDLVLYRYHEVMTVRFRNHLNSTHQAGS